MSSFKSSDQKTGNGTEKIPISNEYESKNMIKLNLFKFFFPSHKDFLVSSSKRNIENN